MPQPLWENLGPRGAGIVTLPMCGRLDPRLHRFDGEGRRNRRLGRSRAACPARPWAPWRLKVLVPDSVPMPVALAKRGTRDRRGPGASQEIADAAGPRVALAAQLGTPGGAGRSTVAGGKQGRAICSRRRCLPHLFSKEGRPQAHRQLPVFVRLENAGPLPFKPLALASSRNRHAYRQPQVHVRHRR